MSIQFVISIHCLHEGFFFQFFVQILDINPLLDVQLAKGFFFFSLFYRLSLHSVSGFFGFVKLSNFKQSHLLTLRIIS